MKDQSVYGNFIKPILDIAAALTGLALFTLPMVLIALWIKLDSPGPVFFLQDRVGRHGRVFRMVKFRTMVADAHRLGPIVTIGQDKRITRAGARLRKWKLDELPQLLNILAGEMSVVGPRPELPNYWEFFSGDERTTLLSVRPGLTDPASLVFFDEAAILAKAEDPVSYYRQTILPQKTALRIEYVRNLSFSADLALTIRTAITILRSIGQ